MTKLKNEGGDQATSMPEARREIVNILGWSQLPDAVQMRSLGLFATYEMNFLRVLEYYSDDLVTDLLNALRTQGAAFMIAASQMMFVNLAGWMRVEKLDSRGLKRLETVIRYASACEHARHPEVLVVARDIEGWTRAMSSSDKETLVAVLAAAHVYAGLQNDSWKEYPKESSPIVQYTLDHSEEYLQIAAIVRQRGCDIELVDLMLHSTTSLHDGVL